MPVPLSFFFPPPTRAPLTIRVIDELSRDRERGTTQDIQIKRTFHTVHYMSAPSNTISLFIMCPIITETNDDRGKSGLVDIQLCGGLKSEEGDGIESMEERVDRSTTNHSTREFVLRKKEMRKRTVQ